MSGRKSTEVNALLARGKNAREAGMANFLNMINKATGGLKENQKEIAEIYGRVYSWNPDIRKESEGEFPQESSHIQMEYERIRKSIQKVDYSNDIDYAESKKQSIDTRIIQADKKGDKIREKIRNKSWYCDDEYRAADKLVREYQDIANAKNKLATEMNRRAKQSNQTLVRYQALMEQFDQIIRAEQELNEKAAKIVELRRQAGDARAYVKRIFGEIDRELAEKFLSKEYHNLETEVNVFYKLGDEEIVDKVSGLTESISILSNTVDRCYSEFLEKKKKAESAVNTNKMMLNKSSNFYFDPMDYAKNKDNADRISLLDYLKEYSGKKDLIEEIEDGMRKAEDLLSAEDFNGAEEQAEKNSSMLQQANQYAALLQEHMVTNYLMAKDMRNVMKRMGFEVGAYKVDGHIKNGWRISATNPSGESIDFTKVFVDDNGKPSIEINHKTMGDCPSKWSDICRNLEDKDIFIEKIEMENGTTILDKRNGKSEENMETESDGNRIVSTD